MGKMNKKNIKIGFFIFIIISLTGCISVSHGLVNENNYYEDYRQETEIGKYFVILGLGDGVDLFQYSKDTLLPRLLYSMSIHTPKCPIIKLNSFAFTRSKDKDTIPFILYYKSLYLEPVIIDSLPFILPSYYPNDSLAHFEIVAECSESYLNTKEVYISYDIEFGEDRIVRKNIHYKKKLDIEIRPKIW